MERTQRLRTLGGDGVHDAAPGISGASPMVAVLVVGALVVALFAYAVLRAGPSVVGVLNPWVSSLPSATSAHGWVAPSVAVGALLAGGALAAMVLAAFVQGVRRDPFRWLAPVLIAFSSIVMTRVGLERAMGPLPASLFGALSALLLLGGGVLVQVEGLIASCCGAVLLTLPVLGLGLDHAHQSRGVLELLSARDSTSLLALVVLAMTSVGVGLTAWVGRPSGGFARAAARARDWQQHREQLAGALDRARVTELQLASTQERMQVLEQALSERASYGQDFAAEEAAFAAATRPSGALRVWLALALVVTGASAGAVAWQMLRVAPLHAQVASERDAATAAIAASKAELEGLSAELARERTRMSEELATEKLRADAALAEAQAAKAQLVAGAESEQASAAAVPTPTAKATATVSRVKRKPSASAAKKTSAAAADRSSGLREAVSDDPIAGLE